MLPFLQQQHKQEIRTQAGNTEMVFAVAVFCINGMLAFTFVSEAQQQRQQQQQCQLFRKVAAVSSNWFLLVFEL